MTAPAMIGPPTPAPRIVSLNRSETHGFSKTPAESVTLLRGIGVEGDAHAGRTVQHRSRLAKGAHLPNLRQVHLLAAELLEEVAGEVPLRPGDLGENVTTRGIDLLALRRGTRLLLGAEAVIEVTGLRNPCLQIEAFRPGLLARVVWKGADGELVRRAGIMAVVQCGGRVHRGDAIVVVPPEGPAEKLVPV